MQTPLQITLRGLAHSDELAAHLQQRVEKLDRICDRIISCHVVIGLEGHHHHGNRCQLTIHLVLPEHEIVVHDAPQEERSFESATAKADRAFDDVERQLGHWVGRQRERRHERKGAAK
jgi:ribosome-associated translation inhibitor RaiA